MTPSELRPLTAPPFSPAPHGSLHRFRFRHFSTRMVLLIVGLVASLEAATYLLLARVYREDALARINEDLDLGARLFQRQVDQRVAGFITGARLMSGDYAIRQLFLQPELDHATIRSALLSYSERLGTPVMVLLTPDGSLIADTRSRGGAEVAGFRKLIQRAAEGPGDQQASGFAVFRQGGLDVLVVVPLYAPIPEVAAWIGMEFPIDDAFAANLRRSTRVEATFLWAPGPEAAALPVATTLPPAAAAEIGQESTRAKGHSIVELRGEPYVTTFRSLRLLSPGVATIALQRSLAVELAPFRHVEWLLRIIIPTCLAIAALMALVIARGVSHPVRVLAGHTEHIIRGDYQRRLELDRADEFGDLAAAFNRMSAGLADRDRVRDLLGKVVSPEIASQLLRSEAALGGEEREVTILFCDLRNFTGLSEKLPPQEVLALLNRYLDRMSAIIEAHQGVIDKYIGDAIMALFGAPVADAGAADHALAAAAAMDAALNALNAELAAENRPQLEAGIGINTAAVVAGNMGSRRRLNYTVIGDGVNVAARLEALTKDPGYRTRVLVSESTVKAARQTHRLKPLGSVLIRGRAEHVKVFAIEPETRHPVGLQALRPAQGTTVSFDETGTG